MSKFLAVLKSDNLVPKTQHYAGFPEDLSKHENSGEGRRLLMPAAFITIQENPDGIFLYRFDKDGNVVGDTWHMTIEDAKYQANDEYGKAVERWIDIPAEETNIVSFGLKCLHEDIISANDVSY